MRVRIKRKPLLGLHQSSVQSKFVQKYGNAFDTAAIAEEHHIKVGTGKPGKSQITAQVQVLGKRELPRGKKVRHSFILLFYLLLKSCFQFCIDLFSFNCELKVQWFLPKQAIPGSLDLQGEVKTLKK